VDRLNGVHWRLKSTLNSKDQYRKECYSFHIQNNKQAKAAPRVVYTDLALLSLDEIHPLMFELSS